MRWLWCPLFLIFAIIEYFNQTSICGSSVITGQMWFMWFMMGIATSRLYFEKVCKCL